MPLDIDDKVAQAISIVKERELCKKDKLYLAKVLGYDFCEDVHTELFDQFIKYDDSLPWAHQSEHTKRLILWPRGHFKTYAVHVAVIQAIINFPDIRILLMQFGLKNTKKLMKAIMAHFTGTAQGSRFRELFPEFCSKKIGSTKELEYTPTSFTTPARKKRQLPQGTVECASAKSGKTGQHYDIAFVDDLICDQNYKSETGLANAEEDFHMAMPLLDPPFYVVVTGTRYAHGDLYEKIIRADAVEKKWIISVKTCWTDDGNGVRFEQRLTKDGRFIGFTTEMLLDIAKNTPAIFASQYMNRPASEAKEIFTEEMLNGACIDSNSTPLLSQAVLFIDSASSENEWSDDSVIIAGKTDAQGRMYVVDVDGGTWLPDDFAKHVIQMTLKHRPLKVMVENTASGKTFAALVRLLAAQYRVVVPIELLPVSNVAGAKAIRISAVKGYIQSKRLWFFKGLKNWDKMVSQFKKFTGVKTKRHDDYPDTVALMAQKLAERSIGVMQQRRPTSMVELVMQQAQASIPLSEPKNSGYNETCGWGFE